MSQIIGILSQTIESHCMMCDQTNDFPRCRDNSSNLLLLFPGERFCNHDADIFLTLRANDRHRHHRSHRGKSPESEEKQA